MQGSVPHFFTFNNKEYEKAEAFTLCKFYNLKTLHGFMSLFHGLYER